MIGFPPMEDLLGTVTACGSACLPMFMLLALGGFLVWQRKRSRAATDPATMVPNWVRFMQATSYRRPGMEQAPLEQQAHAMTMDFHRYVHGGGQKKAFTQHLVKHLGEGYAVHSRIFMGYDPHDPTRYVTSATWTMALPQTRRVLFHIASKHIGGVGEALKDSVQRAERVWSPAYPQRITTGDPRIDGAFNVWGQDPVAVAQVLTTSGLAELLSGCAEVDLVVTPTEVSFSDPRQKNLLAAVGGTIGAWATGMDTSKMLDMTAPMHVRLCDIVAIAARATTRS